MSHTLRRRSPLVACQRGLRPARAPRASGGFTLIEILVAFTIMALVFGGLLRVFSGGLKAARNGEEYTRAVMLAQSKLSELTGDPELSETATSGNFNAEYGRDQISYRWESRIEPYEGDEYAAVEDRPLLQPWVAVVDVYWSEGERSKKVTLTSLALTKVK